MWVVENMFLLGGSMSAMACHGHLANLGGASCASFQGVTNDDFRGEWGKYQGILHDVKQREGFCVQLCCQGVTQIMLHSTYHIIRTCRFNISYGIYHTVIRVSYRVSRRYQNPPAQWNN